MKLTMDNSESLGLMEPVKLAQDARKRAVLADRAIELAQASASLRSSLPAQITKSLTTLVQSMNCYYSNLIEGHDTHPIDIERALKNDYSNDPKNRTLQQEAKAHIQVQQWIDDGGLTVPATDVESIREIHRRFCEALPQELLHVENPQTGKSLTVIPGEFRTHYVQIGKHTPISPTAVPRFLRRFSESFSGLGKAETILSAAAAHHRLAWIHPFLDGNGRVIRLMSHAMLYETLDTGGLWSIARGLARNEQAYKAHLSNCDLKRRNDLDGRGNLSEEALVEFTEFFLKICLDQVAFMAQLIQPDSLRGRILGWVKDEIMEKKLPEKSERVLDALLYRGEIPRRDLPELLNVGPRQSSRIVSALIDCGVVDSDSSRAPIRISFPATLARRLMPGLFPDR